MGFVKVFAHVREFTRLVRAADGHFRRHRPDAVVLIDYPGFNWWIARRAHAQGIPVFYFVPPQVWAWATWRVQRLRNLVDHVFSNLPFEHEWYQRQGVNTHWIGHPYFDGIAHQERDQEFVEAQRAKVGTVVGILPGSRRHELENNFTSQLRAAALIAKALSDVRFLVAGFKEEQARFACQRLREQYPAASEESGSFATGYRGGWSLPVEVCVGRTAEIIHVSHSCIAVSGSVSLELLNEARPATVLFRVTPLQFVMGKVLIRARYMSLVNLLLDRELLPEFPVVRCPARPMAEHVLRWLDDPAAWQAVRSEMLALREKVAQPGACERAARHILEVLRKRPIAA
jgi:lipid-A-disaccharide synthase